MLVQNQHPRELISIKVCLYAGADWQKLIYHSEGGEKSTDYRAGKQDSIDWNPCVNA